MKRILSITTMLALVLGLAFSSIPQDADARSSSRSSSSRSSGSSWGSRSSKPAAKPAPAKTSSWGKKATTTNNTRTGTAAKTATKSPTAKKAPVMSAADKAAHAKAKAAGTSFKSKNAATSSFKSNPAMKAKYAQKATPGKPAPATRPDHIPSTTKGANGSTVNINYNSQYGGYGYMGPSGSWMMYNAMADVAMMSVLMSRNNYMVQPVVVHRSGSSAMLIIFSILGLFVVVGIVFGITRN